MASSSSTLLGKGGVSGAWWRTTSRTWLSDTVQDLNDFLPIYQAVLRDDWQSVRNFISGDPHLITAKITPDAETALHIAVRICKSVDFIQKLLDLMTPSDVALVNNNGDTALSVAAIVGNTEAAKLLVSKNPELPNIWNKNGGVPLHCAAQYGHKEMVLFLLNVTRDDTCPNPLADDSGVQVLIHVIAAGFYDIAIHMVKRNPKLALQLSGDCPDCPALSMLARKPTAFFSGSHLNYWQRFIYSCVSVELEINLKNLENFRLEPIGEDIENPGDIFQVTAQKWYNHWIFKEHKKWRRAFWGTIEKLVPYIKHLRDVKLMHCQAYQLVECLCKEIKELRSSDAYSLLKEPLLSGAELGICEIVEQIVQSFPYSIWITNDANFNIFHLAVLHRRENIFNLIYEMDGHRELLTQSVDYCGRNILHIAGLLPLDGLDILSGAALQVQRELQWYKEVEKFVQPMYKEMRNLDGDTPAEIFTRKHKDLVREGEKWMKDTAISCTIAAVLIAAVGFAAAITVPGGNNNDTGLPSFSKKKAFVVFVIADALSLFTSMASLLMFLSILTSRYAEADFLYDLPKKLMIQLGSLYLSISFMIVAFSVTLYLVLDIRNSWMVNSMIILAPMLMTLFASLQLPLLVDMIRSTYGAGIFGKPSRQLFHKSDRHGAA